MPRNHDNEDGPEWERWRGQIEMKLEAQQAKIEDHCDRLKTVEEQVSQILVKLAVPIFITSIVGVGLGGLIVALLTKTLK